MKTSLADSLLQHPLSRRIGWVLYAIVFYISGESFVIWLLEPHNFSGGIRWLGVAAFPVLFIAFFFIQRHLGCASGQCPVDDADGTRSKDNHYQPPPGM
ncbi:MAG: hypothetical protein SV201_06490 [Pseudomonadota bacterium]|nr:hypothetical protein [Pseudomonadota bacterium]